MRLLQNQLQNTINDIWMIVVASLPGEGFSNLLVSPTVNNKGI